jgi:hypothetical protein
MRQFSHNWYQPSFDDSNWQTAQGLIRNSGWPSAQKNELPRAITTPWTNLEQRHIPYLTERDIRAEKLIEARTVASYFYNEVNPKKRPKDMQLTGEINQNINMQDYLDGKSPLLIPASNSDKTWFLLFDLGKVHSGMPQFDIEGGEGTEIEVIAIPFMVNNNFTYRVVDTDLLDKVTLSGERDQWQAQYFKPTRYIALAVKPGATAVKIHSLGLHQIEYPFEKQGSITSQSLPWLDQYMKATEKTINTCTTDGYTDNYRERRQYAQTGYYGAMGNYWTFGDLALQAIKLVQVAQEVEPNGMFLAYGPFLDDDYMVILDSNMLWLRSLHNYYLYSGDRATVESLLPTAFKLLDLVTTYTNDDGLIDNPPYSYWLDHARNDRRGANLNLNGHYVGALQDFAQLLTWLGDEAKGLPYQAQATKIKTAIQTKFWHDKKGLFVDTLVDGKQSTQFSEHAQAMALSLGMATEKQAKRVAENVLANDKLNFIKRDSGMFMVTPAMSYFLHKGLAEYGYVDQSMALFKKRFDHMLADDKNGTLWEEWWLDGSGRSGKKALKDRTRSDAQTESAFAPGLFAEYLLGVQPTKPGMSELTIKRTKANIKDINGQFPTPQGLVKVVWTFKDKGGSLVLDIPPGITVKLDRSSLITNGDADVDINGQTVTSKEISISSGQHRIEFIAISER